jgi:hypothetical protein
MQEVSAFLEEQDLQEVWMCHAYQGEDKDSKVPNWQLVEV